MPKPRLISDLDPSIQYQLNIQRTNLRRGIVTREYFQEQKQFWFRLQEQINEDRRQKELARQKAEKKRKQVEKARATRLRNKIMAYPSFGNEIVGFGMDAFLDEGIVAQWVSKIPSKNFILRYSVDGVTKEVIKRDNQSNIEWFGSGQYWNFLANSDLTIWQSERAKTGSLSVSYVSEVQGEKGKQRLRDGELHCIWYPLGQMFERKLMSTDNVRWQRQLKLYIKRCAEFAIKYDMGITVEELEEELKSINTTVYMYSADRKTFEVFNPRSKWSFFFINNRWNHAEVFVPDSEPILLSPQEMESKKTELDNTRTNYSWESTNKNIKSIFTSDSVYKTQMPFNDMFKEFDRSIGKDWYAINYVKEPTLVNYIQEAYKHNPHMRFCNDDATGAMEMDCEKGYTQFKKAPVYKGFLGTVWDRCGPIPLPDVYKTTGIFTIRVLDVSEPFRRVGFEIGELYTLTSPMIEFLTKPRGQATLSDSGGVVYGMKAEVLYGVYGSRFDFDFPTEFHKKYNMKTGELGGEKGIPLYTLWSGSNAAVSDKRCIRSKMDYRMAQHLKSEGTEVSWEYD